MCVPPTPFGRKDWEKPDTGDFPYPPENFVRLAGVVSDTGRLAATQMDPATGDTMESDLEKLSEKIRRPFVFVSHSPPYGTPLDLLDNGVHVGSPGHPAVHRTLGGKGPAPGVPPRPHSRRSRTVGQGRNPHQRRTVFEPGAKRRAGGAFCATVCWRLTRPVPNAVCWGHLRGWTRLTAEGPGTEEGRKNTSLTGNEKRERHYASPFFMVHWLQTARLRAAEVLLFIVAGGSAVELDFDLFGQPFVVLPQDGNDFIANRSDRAGPRLRKEACAAWCRKAETRSSLPWGQVRRDAMPSHL